MKDKESALIVLWASKDLLNLQKNNKASVGQILHESFIVYDNGESVRAKYGIDMLKRPPYSPELAPCNFYFPMTNMRCRGTKFEKVKLL